MNALILYPGIHNFNYNIFSETSENSISAGKIDNYRDFEYEKLAQIASSHKINAIIVRVIFGGDKFDKPVLADSHVIQMLEQLIPYAPLHLPGAIRLINACSEIFEGLPIVLVFETAFFASLPQREYLYGIDPELSGKKGLRRFGCHGIYHQAACAKVSSKLRGKKITCPHRIISICLDDKSDVVAIKGRKSLMITEGATPLEGLPGRTSCGDIDPSIVLTLAEKLKYSAEEVNSILTKHSGLLGLTGKDTNVKEILISDKKDFAMANDIFKYKLLNSCGAAMAAMGGADAIVFSGKYADAGKDLGDFLTQNLTLAAVNISNKLECYFQTDPIEKFIFDTAANTLKQSCDKQASSCA